MDYIIKTIIFLLIITFYYCKSNNETSNSNQTVFKLRDTLTVGDVLENTTDSYGIYDETDTTLFFKKNDTIFAAIVPKIDLDQFNGFQDFINNNQKLSNELQYIQIADVTGDNVGDSCISKIFFLVGKIFIENTVISNKKQIWFDTLKVTDLQLANLFWGEEESYLALRPYSTHFMVKLYFSGFVSDKYDPYNNNREPYNGYSIWKLDVVSKSNMVWDKKNKKFKIYYAP